MDKISKGIITAMRFIFESLASPFEVKDKYFPTSSEAEQALNHKSDG